MATGLDIGQCVSPFSKVTIGIGIGMTVTWLDWRLSTVDWQSAEMREMVG